MLEIHFLGSGNQPLCRPIAHDRWLWTAAPQAVTCPGCGLLLQRERQHVAGRDAADALARQDDARVGEGGTLTTGRSRGTVALAVDRS